jgi:phosphomannomutase
MKEALKVGISGVRGVVGGSLTPQVASSFAQAFGNFVGKGRVLVGRDTRPTGLMIERAVVAGLQSVGCQPVLMGVVPTPTVLIETERQGARGGICITASHNPVAWNALKFVGPNGLFLDEFQAEIFFDLYHQREHQLVEESDIPTVQRMANPMEAHVEKVLAYVDVERIRAAKFKVALDACNGVGALHSESFLRDHLGCEVTTVLDEPDGLFRREPEPLPENLGELSKAVKEQGCHLGFAQDPDGDRLALLDETGRPIGEDLTLALSVKQVLDAHGAGPVVVNLPSSQVMEAIAKRHGVDVIRTRIGEIYVSTRMLEVEGVVGGENNGGIIIPAIHPCRDSYAGMAVLLELLAMTGKSVAELVAELPAYFLIKDKLSVRGPRVPGILRTLRREYAQYPINLLDGVHINFGDAWVHVRPSNTEPVIRVLAEAQSQERVTELMGEIRGRVEALL